MEFKEYKQVYFNFELATSQTRLISLTAGEALQDFPARLPKETQGILHQLFAEFVEVLQNGISDNPRPQATDSFSKSERNDTKLDTPFFLPILNLFMMKSYANQDSQEMNFGHLLYAQELIMLFAHLDAFISDSVRVMCRKEPRLLYRDKKMSWRAILESTSWEIVVEKMIEEYCYEISWKSVQEKIHYLQSEHGLSIETPPEELDKVDNAEKIRHIVIHNGSRVSQEYLDRTKQIDLKIGEIIPITADYVEDINNKVRMLGSDIFISIAKKFFQISDDDLSGVWRRNRPEAR